ncbi:MAG: N-acetylmuramoyl-L-alanine amidase, partial [Myxococcota bacterium]
MDRAPDRRFNLGAVLMSQRWCIASNPLVATAVVIAALTVCQAPQGVQAQSRYGPMRVIRTIVIDPGHGGSNEGAVGATSHLEKDEVLRVAYAVRDSLAKSHPEVKVVLTRNLDVDVSLPERIQVANALEADLFISLHMNASTNVEAHGFEVFFLRADKSMPLVMAGEGSWGRDFEQAADPVEFSKGLPVELSEAVHRPHSTGLPMVLSDLDKGRAHKDSGLFAEVLMDELRQAFRGRRSRGVRQANFGVLRGALVPAVVVELGFISHATEETWLVEPDTHKTF